MALKPKQLKTIEAILANPGASNTELGEIVNASRNTIAIWKRQEEFQEVLRQRLQEVWKESEAIAINTMQNLALDGNFQAAKYILDNLGYGAAVKVEADINSEININIDEEQ